MHIVLHMLMAFRFPGLHRSFSKPLCEYVITQLFLLSFWAASRVVQILSPPKAPAMLNNCHWLFSTNASGGKLLTLSQSHQIKTSLGNGTFQEPTNKPNNETTWEWVFLRLFKPILPLLVATRQLVFLVTMISGWWEEDGYDKLKHWKTHCS